jgi:DNA-binding CsgD family transcriptional regulator
LAQLARDVASGGAGGVVRVPRPHGKTAFAIMVAPLALDAGLEVGRRRSRETLFVIHDPLQRLPPAPQLVAEMFGLSLGSATLVAALAAGGDLKDYAERAGISMNTVRFHLKTAYARTGVHRQADLVRLVIAALRDLGDHRQEN